MAFLLAQQGLLPRSAAALMRACAVVGMCPSLRSDA